MKRATEARRPYRGLADIKAMTALANRSAADNMHVTDLPYRFSSWALDSPENIALWQDSDGELLGWAVLQTPFWTIDYALHPRAATDLHGAILAWADARARHCLDTQFGRPMWFINVFTTQLDRIRDLEAAGFASQADVGEHSWTKVLMRRPHTATAATYTLPDGFAIRPLAGEAEVPAVVELHRDVFESKSMIPAWRLRTLAQPTYRPDLDLVAVAPDGRLAAFCVGWLNPNGAANPVGQIEPLGVHADFRGLGLGRSILSETLQRVQARGAASIYVETDNYRDQAFLLYESVGFQVEHDVLVYRKDYA